MKCTSFRRRILRTAMAATLCAAFVPAWACEYYAEHFQIIHPSSTPAASGASSVVISMEFTQISSADRLLGAFTPVADRVELIQSTERSAQVASELGTELEPGHDVTLSPASGHLVMRGVNTQLHEGRQYPLTLIFEKAGAVDVEFVVGDH